MKQIVLENLQEARHFLDEYEKSCVDRVVDIAQAVIDSLRNGGCIYLCGNGGSACDAMHIAGELVGRYKMNRKALAAVALNTDGGMLTCIANDFDFEDVYAKQVEGLVTEKDILWAFSCSGKSPNILRAAEMAKNKGARVIAFTGKKNTPLEKLSDLCLSVDAPYAAPAQQVHQLAYHTICDLVERTMFADQA